MYSPVPRKTSTPPRPTKRCIDLSVTIGNLAPSLTGAARATYALDDEQRSPIAPVARPRGRSVSRVHRGCPWARRRGLAIRSLAPRMQPAIDSLQIRLRAPSSGPYGDPPRSATYGPLLRRARTKATDTFPS